MQSGASTWLFFPTAVVLGALHGLEPGHSKTVMTSFIVAVRGTVRQAVLLGLCAAFSHSLIVWILAGVGMTFGSRWNTEATEPYFQLASAALILLIAFWMLWALRRGRHKTGKGQDIRQRFKEVHRHDHGPHLHGQQHHEQHQSNQNHLGHEGLEVGAADFEDAHARAHADDIRNRFTDRNMTTGQIILFGLTGGLIPCTAAITVLLLCLQTHRLLLGFLLVLGFSTGLAATMVASGVLAAWGIGHATKRIRGFSGLIEKAPYLSIAVVIGLGLFMGAQAWIHLK